MKHTHEDRCGGNRSEHHHGRRGMRSGGREGFGAHGPSLSGFGFSGFGPGGHGRGGPGAGGHRGFGRGGDGRGGPGGRRRMFESGELALVLLHLMETQPRHGYDLIKAIETLTGGAYAPSPGIVYPTLTLLEDLGQIEAAASEGSKRLYALTPVGQAYLIENKAQAEAALAKLDALGADTGRVDAGPVFRAMHNLRAVLQQKLSDGSDKQLLFEAVDLIDETARKIERLG